MQRIEGCNATVYPASSSDKAHSVEAEILLHGLGRTRNSFRKLEKSLTARGYRVINLSYPSTKHEIKVLAQDVINRSLQQCLAAAKIHFVSHSMGGILLRDYLLNNHIAKLGHVVMLGPPNQGSEIVDKLRSLPLFSLFNGPAGLQLGTDSKAIANRLPDANYSLGIIAGNRSINLILSTLLPRPNDGKVSVQATKLPGMCDHLVIAVTHPFMMKSPEVIKQVQHFLSFGCFNK